MVCLALSACGSPKQHLLAGDQVQAVTDEVVRGLRIPAGFEPMGRCLFGAKACYQGPAITGDLTEPAATHMLERMGMRAVTWSGCTGFRCEGRATAGRYDLFVFVLARPDSDDELLGGTTITFIPASVAG